MESKRKKPQVRKVQQAPKQAKPKKEKQVKEEKVKKEPRLKPTSAEALLVYNATLVEEMFASEAWTEIAFPLLQEMIASVSGRFTNGRFYQGALTNTKQNRDELSGYQLALEEFYNRLRDFVSAREFAKEKEKQKEMERVAPYINPFLEELNETEEND